MKIRKNSPLLASLVALGVGSVHAADPTPYDSIANPLSNLPQSDTSVQRRGDLLNMKPSRVRVNQAGYRMVDVAAGFGKFYYVGSGQTSFKVIDDSGRTVAGVTGTLTSKGVTVSGQIIADAANSAEHQHGGNGDWRPGYPMTGQTVSGALWQGVLPASTPYGHFRIVVGTDTSAPFVVSDNVYGMARDAALKFFGVARSGPYQSWFHPASHLWDGWLVDSAAKNPDGSYKYKGSLVGGWYDCGNHLKEAVTNAYPLAALGMMAATNKEKDADNYGFNQSQTKMALHNDGVPDVLKEAWVGAQFVLRSFRLANGVPANMYLSVGDPTTQLDFQWWGRPENQDNVMSPNRGGRTERAVLRNAGSESISNFAAGMAYLSRLYRPYDPVFADTALIIAKAMYEYAKTANRKESATDYGSGGSMTQATLAHAAVALLWATRDTKYLNEVAYKPNMPDGRGGICADPAVATAPLVRFNGGFFGCGTNSMVKQWATDYQNTNSFSLYALSKLILADPDTAANYGISRAQRDTLLLRCINNILGSNMAGGGKTVALPVGYGYPYNNLNIAYDSIWYNETVGGSGWYNKYQFGNLADLYMYYDITSIVDGKPLLGLSGGTDWKRKQVLEVLLGGLGYMMGVNPLDLSYIYGIGPKNPNHPHHRAANPEGKNVPGAYYNYAIPVGGLYGGLAPANSMKMTEYFDSPVSQTEANCPDASAVQIIPLMGLARAEPVVPPHPVVKVMYTTTTTAVVRVTLDKWGYVKLKYGLDSTIASQTTLVNGSDTSVSIDVTVTGLAPATQYYFNITAKDLQLDSFQVSKWPNGKSDSIPFGFLTQAVPPQPPIFGNIKVCNVTADSAEIMWVTPNGQYFSSVQYADSADWKSAVYSTMDTDVAGNIPVTFHHVKLYGLKEKTTYYFRVGTPGSYDATVGCFRTPNEDVKFDIRASGYVWSGMRALTIGITNQDDKDYDSLELRLYVTGTAANVWDLGARCDIGIKYRTDGYQDAGFAFIVDQNLRKSHPKKIDSTCLDTQVCQWYFDVPIWGDTMESQARFRLDLVWDKHKVEMSQPPNPVPVLFDDLMNQPPTHDIFDTSNHDWSFRTHVAGTDNGLSPVAYGGVPFTNDASSKEIMDQAPQTVEIDPYIAVYRRNDFVYGFSPFAAEQAKKRVVYAMDMRFNPPFDVSEGSTIQIGNGTSTRLTGTADVYDQLTPGAKGYITAIWVDGVPLASAARQAALTRQSDGTWKFDIPLKFTLGTNKLDVTFFASSDSLDTAATTTTCTESKGCAFHNAEWFVNFASNLTPSQLSVSDASGNPVQRVTPDSSVVTVRLNDGNANLGKTLADSVRVSIFNKGTGKTSFAVLRETAINTGVFQSTFSVVSSTAAAGQLQVRPGDSLFISYVDAQDPTDSSWAALFAKPKWPTAVRAGLFRDCGGTYSVKALFDRAFAAGGWDSARVVLNTGTDSIVDKVAGSAITADASGTTLTIPLPAGISSGGLSGRFDLKEANGQGGWIRNSVVVSDSVGPWLDSVKIAENVSGTGSDSIYFWASEPIASSAPWPFLVRRAGAALASAGFAGSTSAQLLDVQAGKYLLVLPSGILLAGDSVRFDPALVADGKGNDALDCPGGRKVQVISVLFAGLQATLSESCGGSYSVAATFNKAFPTTGGFDSGFVTLSNGTKTVGPFAVPASAIAKDATGKILTLPLPALTYGSNWTGSLDLQVLNDSGRLYTVSVPVSDGVGPRMDSAKIVENLTGNSKDSVFFWSSEPLSAGSTWPLLVTRSGTAVPAATFAGATVAVSDASAGKYLVLLSSGLIAAGDSLRFDPASVSDAAGNAAQNCPNAKPVTVLSRPAPFSRAWISDVDGDGRADRVVVVFRKVVQAKDLPDLVQIRFGAGDSLRTEAVAISQVTDSILTLNLTTPYPFGITRGSATDGSGSISVSKSGEFTGPYVLADSVGPVLLSAGLRYGTAADTLDLAFSEPVKRSGAIGWLVAQPSLELGIIALPDSLSPTHWRLPVNPGAVSPGDSVRPLPSENWVEDRSGRLVASFHPWIPVTGGERAPLFGWFRDGDGDGAVDQAVVVFAKAPRTLPGMRFLWPSIAGGFDTAVVDSGKWSLDPSGTTATISVGPFGVGVTRSSTIDLGRWVSAGTWNFAMYDSVPPVLVSAEVRYASTDGVPDSLHVRWSEPVLWSGAGSLVRHKYLGAAAPLGTLTGILYDRDSLGGFLLLDTGVIQLRRGDSAAFAAGIVQDKPGNAVSQITRWVPVKFGLRPARMDSKLQSYLEYEGWDPRPGPAAQVWVRARGDAQWLSTDSVAVPDTSHTVSVVLTLNRILTGAAYIYDNAGTYVTSVDLSGIASMAAQNKLPTDPSGMFQMKVSWSGWTENGILAGSGIYIMRLVLKDSSPDNPHGVPVLVNRIYKLGFKRATK